MIEDDKFTYETWVNCIRDWTEKYFIDSKLKSAVIGVSGGIDSALCCALIQPICRKLGIPLIGRSITIESNKPEEIKRARLVGGAFCDDFVEIQLAEVFQSFAGELLEDANTVRDIEYKIRRGNMKARTRMMYLYDIAQRNHGLVLSTDNYTEYLLGFWTLHGDVGDFGMIQNLWKTEVYEMANFLSGEYGQKPKERCRALELCIDATPTDGLGITNSDLDQLGADSYKEVDHILKIWLTNDEDAFCWDTLLRFGGRHENYDDFVEHRESFKDHSVVKRYLTTQYKRRNPFNIPRDCYFTWEQE